MKRILILMSDTGGGHRACAQALQAAFRERYGDEYRVDVLDIWMDYTRWPLNQMPKSYRFLINDVPWMWRSMWELGERPQALELAIGVWSHWSRKPVSQVIAQHDPDLLIAAHPLMQDLTLRILAQTRRNIPLVTVVTDLVSIHPIWFRREALRCFVTSDESYRLALQAGLPPDSVRQYGLAVRPAFAREAPPKEQLRPTLGLRPDLPVALLTGGGEGMGPIGAIAQAVAGRLAAEGQPRGQLVVICGRNRKLQQELRGRTWPIPTIINGFVDNMPDWMAASDCIITKAGSVTIAEAMVCGLPILLSGYIAGQEEGNIPYVVENGIGVYSPHPQRIAEVVGNWFGPERARLEEMAQKARRMGRPQAAFQIVQDIAGLLAEMPTGDLASRKLHARASAEAVAPQPPSPFVREYYDQNAAREWERLEGPFRKLEFLSTFHLWDKYFPKTGHVCDIGCGPGRYAIELLKRGYRVTLFDFSSESLALARAKIAELGLRAEEYICADARNLSSLGDDAFDAVLLMGPMYHVIRKEERLAILHETRRILKKGGMAMIAYINAWGAIRAGITGFSDSYADIGHLRSLLNEKVYEGPGKVFTECYLTTPPVALAEVRDAGLEVLSYAGVESFAAGLRDGMKELAANKPEVYANVLQVAAECCELEQYRDVTEHLHIIARK